MLAAVSASGRGHVAAPDGKEPAPSPAAWGWADGRGRGGTIGWTRRGELYLDPDATYAALAALARDQGGAYPVTQQTLCRRQKEAGQLLRTDGDRTTYPETLGGTRRRVLVLAASVLGQPGQPGQPGQLPPPPEQSVPVSCPGSADPPSEPGQETGTDRPAEHRPVPAVPVVPSAENGEAADAAEERDPPTA
jgi:hypothetical protein